VSIYRKKVKVFVDFFYMYNIFEIFFFLLFLAVLVSPMQYFIPFVVNIEVKHLILVLATIHFLTIYYLVL
jgi:hypothetical protein